MRALPLPHLRRPVILGGRKRPAPPKPGAKLLRLADYISAPLPPPPASVDYSAAGQPGLGNIFLNDRLGCCVIAAGAHVTCLATGNAGAEFIYTDDEIVAQYSAIGGYVPGQPSTDQGCDEQTAFNFWLNTGFSDGTKLAAWIALDPTNPTEMQQAALLFENLFFGVDLPDAWISPFPSAPGFVWTPGTPDPNNGHAFCGVGYNAQGAQIDTWGLLGTVTWDAIATLCAPGSGGQVYTLLTPDSIAKASQKAPNGFDWTTLQTDAQALAVASRGGL